MKTALRILFVEDSEDDANLMLHQIRKGGYDVEFERVETEEKLRAALNKKKWDIILSDYTMPHLNGLEALAILNESCIDIPFIMVSGNIGEDLAVEAMKAGAHYYIMKNNLELLLPAVERELRESEQRAEKRMLEQKQILAEKALFESEERYHLLFQKSADGILIVDVDTKNIKYANPALCRMLGYTEEEFRTMELADIHPKHNLQHVVAEFESLSRGDKTMAADIPCLRKDGSIVYADINSTNITMDGRACALGLFRDITERKQAMEALKKSEIKLKVIIESTADGILAIDSSGKVIKTNNRFAELWKIPPAVLDSGDNAALLNFMREQLINPEHFLDKVQQLYNSTDEDSDTLYFKDGRIFERYSAPLILDDKIIGRVWSFSDITKRKRAEETLQHERLLLRTLIDNVPDLIYSKDRLCRKTLANLVDVHTLGANSEADVLGKDDFAFYPKEMAEGFVNDDLMVMQKGVPVLNREEYIIDEKGRKTWLLTSKLPLRDKDNQIIGLVGIGRDITVRKQAEEALLDSEQRYRLLIETANEGILVAQNGFLKFVNPMAQVITGYNQEELLTLPFINYVHPEDQEIVKSNHLKRLKEEPLLPRYHFRIVKKDGSIRSIEMSGIKIDWEGQPATLNMLTDITERIRTEKEIQLKNEQLLKLNAEKDKFFSIIAHDLRGPFGGFLGLTELMAEELTSLSINQIQEFSVNMRKSASNLFRLLENLLQWSKMQQGAIPFNPELLQLLQVVDESITMVIEQANNKGIEITYDISNDLMVVADNNMLQTVIRNLITNSVKFTPRLGKVHILAKTTEGQNVELSVSDTGIGMSLTMIDNLFRLDLKTNRKGTEGEPSSGLGLLLCKEFVDKHGGRIWAESEEGKGTTIYFTLQMKS